MFSCDNTSKSLLDEPATPIIPEPSNVIKVMFSIWLIPFTGLELDITLSEINVPSDSGSKVFLMRIGMFFLKTG